MNFWVIYATIGHLQSHALSKTLTVQILNPEVATKITEIIDFEIRELLALPDPESFKIRELLALADPESFKTGVISLS